MAEAMGSSMSNGSPSEGASMFSAPIGLPTTAVGCDALDSLVGS
jgi:hypothetical protein